MSMSASALSSSARACSMEFDARAFASMQSSACEVCLSDHAHFDRRQLVRPGCRVAAMSLDEDRVRVLVADDHPGLLDRVVRTLARDFTVVGAVGDGEQLVAAEAALQPDVLVI